MLVNGRAAPQRASIAAVAVAASCADAERTAIVPVIDIAAATAAALTAAGRPMDLADEFALEPPGEREAELPWE